MWKAITVTDVESVMAGPELEAVRHAAGDSDGGDADMLPAIITTVTNEIRAHIEDCPENRIGASGTLPERVHHHALAVIRYRLLSRLDMAVGDGRTKEYDDAVAFVRRVSECKVKIEQPDGEDVVSEAVVTTVDVVTQTTQQMRKSQLGGLF